MAQTSSEMVLDMKNGILDLYTFGQKNLRHVHRNLPAAVLCEKIITNNEGQLSRNGAIVARAGDAAERPLSDKYIVKEPVSEEKVVWEPGINAMTQENFTKLLYRLVSYIQNKDVYVQYCKVGRDPHFALPVRFVTETALHSLFVRNMYQPITDIEDFSNFDVGFSVVHIPGFRAAPESDGTQSESFVLVNLGQKVVFICGTHYAGEIRQAVFSVLNYLLAPQKVLLLRCAANTDADQNSALFIGRGGTGKTTLALDPERRFIGDHAHGWTDQGVFNFENGIYAKMLNVSAEQSPRIFQASRQFGTILENVSIDTDSRQINPADGGLTTNTRASFSMASLSDTASEGIGAHPKHIFFLTVDAMGVLPPIARLTPDLAVYAFMSGYTSRFDADGKLKTVTDIHFNTCFGANTPTLPAHVYGDQLMARIKQHHCTCWLVNTGWSGRPHDSGERLDIGFSRKLVRAAVDGSLDAGDFETDPIFGYEIPKACPGIDPDMLDPRKRSGDPGAYVARAEQLAGAFMKDFSESEADMPENLREALADVLSPATFDVLDSFKLSI